MDTLATIYERLRKNPDDLLRDIKLYHSDVHYTWAHIKQKFSPEILEEYGYNSIDDIYKVMKEEGLINE